MIITYGVYGKVELAIILAVGNCSIPVDFEGGSINSRGVIPATYKTNNPVVQKGIENSLEFKHGIIKKIQSIPEKADIENSRKMQAAKEAAAKADALVKQKADQANVPATEPAEKVDEAAAGENEATQGDVVAETVVNEVAEEVLSEVSGKTEVKVTCQEDAVEYLKANFEGYTSTKLRTKTAVMQAAEEHNLVFVGL